MDGNLAAAATLVAHTRAWRGGHTRRPSFSPLSAFRFSGSLKVDIPVGLVIPGREKYAPRAPRAWLDWYPRVRARDLRLGVVGGVIRDDALVHKAQMATFSPFTFTAVDTRGKGVARAAERVVNPTEVEGALWHLHFVRVYDTSLLPAPGIKEAGDNLLAAIASARTVGVAERALKQWVPYLDHAVAILRGDAAPQNPSDMLPPVGYTTAARLLVAAATQAWVVGGPGTWSDHEPRGREARALYLTVSAELYACLIEAIGAAVNEGLVEE